MTRGTKGEGPVKEDHRKKERTEWDVTREDLPSSTPRGPWFLDIYIQLIYCSTRFTPNPSDLGLGGGRDRGPRTDHGGPSSDTGYRCGWPDHDTWTRVSDGCSY